MLKIGLIGIFLAVCLICLPPRSHGQNEVNPGPTPPSFRTDRNVNEDRPLSFREQQSKNRIARERKEHEEMVRRGEEALSIADRLESSLVQNERFSNNELRDLAELEKIVAKIRKDLGGGGDKENEKLVEEELTNANDLREAFLILHKTTGDLMGELKKTTRFTISAAAIQASNTVISITRFLRLRKQ